MPKTMTPERLAERICRCLSLPTAGNAENLTELLREVLTEVWDASVKTTKVVCLEVADGEAERCRSVGASVAQPTALNIAARVRKRHVAI